MSLPAVLSTGLALILLSPGWTAAAEQKGKPSAVASDRHASPSRVARKDTAREKRPQSAKEAAQTEQSRKGRTEKEAVRKEPAQRRADKRKETARSAQAEKEAAPPKERMQKRRAEKEISRKEADEKERARKQTPHKETARNGRAEKRTSRKNPDQTGSARKEASKKEEARKEGAGKGRAQSEAARKQRGQQERAANERVQNERAQDDQQEGRRTTSELSPDNETIAALRQKLRALRKQVDEVGRLRAELAAIRAQIRGSAPKPVIWGGVPLTVPSLSASRSGNPEIAAPSLGIPDVRGTDRRPLQPPEDPATATLPAAIREGLRAAPLPRWTVEEAKAYLVETAMPGYTMMRQGVSISIDRLHPAFAVRLAEAVQRARAEGMASAGIFSAYRPPAFGVGGFRDKFDSLHSYGLATDIAGIGRPGSASARRWHQIVVDVGLYLPYGPGNRAEFNHTQFVPAKVAPKELRETITAEGPMDLREMWRASGVDDHVSEPTAVAVADGSNGASAEAVAGMPGSGAPVQGE